MHQLQQEDCADPRILISEHSLLTPGWELFGVDYFGSIFLACAQLDTTSDDWKSSPEGKKRNKTRWRIFHCKKRKRNSISTHSPLGWKKIQLEMPSVFVFWKTMSELNEAGSLLVSHHQVKNNFHISVWIYRRAKQIYWHSFVFIHLFIYFSDAEKPYWQHKQLMFDM